MVVVLHYQAGYGGDWLYFTEGFDLLVHGHANVRHEFTTVHYGNGGLHLYGSDPDIQIGPLALLLAGVVMAMNDVSRYLAPTVLILVGLATLGGVERTALRMSPGTETKIRQLTLVGGVLVMYAWVQAFVQWRHLDAMLVVVGAAVALSAVARRQPWLLGAAIGLSVAAKPTALVLLPLLFALDKRANLNALAVAATLIGAFWLPFVIADPATLHAGAPQIPIRLGSGLAALGLRAGGAAPSAIRAAQLLVALIGGGFAVVRRRWYLVPVIGFALRAGLDPSVESYYAIPVVMGALAADLLPAPTVPTTTMLTWLVFSEPFGLPGNYYWRAPSMTVQAWLRLCLPVVLAIVLVATPDRHTRAHPPADREPQAAPLERISVHLPAGRVSSPGRRWPRSGLRPVRRGRAAARQQPGPS